MSKKRKQYSPAFKSKVALVALRGEEATSEIAARFEVHPTMVSTWKRELQDKASDLLVSKQNKPRKGADAPDTD